jgi:hypothetical protein
MTDPKRPDAEIRPPEEKREQGPTTSRRPQLRDALARAERAEKRLADAREIEPSVLTEPFTM